MPRFGFGRGNVRHSAGAGRIAIGLEIETCGVRFTFSAARPVGQYANGDWWVRGPVTITAISPASALHNGQNWDGTSYSGRVINGTMLNPGNRVYAAGGLLANNATNTVQGWDTLTATSTQNAVYSAAANVDPGATGTPLVVASGSVVKFVSRLTGLPSGNRPVGADMVVLTVVDAIPAPDAIRPGVSTAETKASRIRLSDVNLGVFQNLAPTANAPTFEQAMAWVRRYIETSMPDSVNNGNAKATNNHREYGREIANDLHRSLLCLHLSSFTGVQKRQLLAGFATIAEDIISRAEEGSVTPPDGGGNQWKLALLYCLAASLGDKVPAAWTTYLSPAQNLIWGENTQMFTVTPYDVAMPRKTSDGRPRSPYTTQMLGSVDWGTAPIVSPDGNHSQWDTSTTDLLYRSNVGYSSVLPGMLAVELTTGAKALWQFPQRWLYYNTMWPRRTEGPGIAGGNKILPFPLEMLEAYRTPVSAAPVVAEATVRGADLWLRCDISLTDNVAAPAASAFAVLVNGVARTVTATTVWRQNVGLTLASPTTHADVVTVAYTTPGSNRVRSADGVSLASFSARAVTNRNDRFGGTNTSFPVVRFMPGVQRQTVYSGGTLAPADAGQGTIALLRFRFPAAPAVDTTIFGTLSGNAGFRILLLTTRRLQFIFANAAGTTIGSFSTPVLSADTDYDILASIDVTQATAAAGLSCFINGTAQTLQLGGWSGGAGVVIGWARDNSFPYVWNRGGAITFDLGAFWLDATTRVDITSAAERAKFGPSAIGSRGEGVTGSIPAQFHAGNAGQWNDLYGMNRGSSPVRFFPNFSTISLGNLVGVGEQQEWGVTPPPSVANVSASVQIGSPGHAITLLPSGIFNNLAIAIGPSKGTVSLSGSTATYTPNAGYSGPDSFTYTATGPGGTSSPATVSVNVMPVQTTADNTSWTADSSTITADRTN